MTDKHVSDKNITSKNVTVRTKAAEAKKTSDSGTTGAAGRKADKTVEKRTEKKTGRRTEKPAVARQVAGRRKPETASPTPASLPASLPASPSPPVSAATKAKAPDVAAKPAASTPAAPGQKQVAAPLSAALGAEFGQFAEMTGEIFADAGKASVAMFKGLEEAKPPVSSEESVDLARAFGAIAEYWLKDPTRLVKAQKDISIDLINLWSSFLKQADGGKAEPVVEMPARDPRFADKDWSENPYFNMLRQAYFLGSRWADALVAQADVDEATKRKAGFYMRQLAGALSPSNYVMTNPELLRQTAEEKGQNLARGMKMLAEDFEAGKGQLKIRQSDPSPFRFGENIANTPGKVVFRNELIELIQYAPATQKVYKTPLLIVPPWINKFYILDLNAEKSFVRWAVSEGLTVFVISWINPDERHRAYDFTAYMQRGVLAALDAVLEISGESSADTIGYCVGGTILSITLAYIAQDPAEARKIRSATLFTTQVDFTHAGDLLAFVDEAQIRSVEETMAETGYLPGAKMASAFNMLRPNDLIWSYVVNNYLKGKNPAPFDLLYWNADSTRMTEANHSFYLRNCYLNNNLSQGKMVVGGRRLDLGLIRQKIYNLATREDHIAPAKSVFEGSKFFGGEVTYVLAGSGHIAGVINPAAKPKYQYWTNGPVKGDFEAWCAAAHENPGSWWPHWRAWITAAEPMVPARMPGSRAHPPLEDAPGLYVRIKA